MRALKDVLQETIVVGAKPAVPIEPVDESGAAPSFDLKSANDGRTINASNGKGPFDPAVPGPWSFRLTLEDAGPRVLDLECFVPCETHSMNARVCEEILFGAVEVSLHGRSIPLPLTRKYLLAHSALREDGRLAAGSNRFYGLEAAINFGVQLVFAYELRGGELVPFSRRVREAGDFSDFVDDQAGAPARFRVDRGGRPTRRILGLPPRFLVCASFTAHKPRNDFEPLGVMLAARMVPALFVRANCALDAVRGKVRLRRPERTSMAGMMAGVAPEIGSVFFADRNNAGRFAPPTWDNIFDYYVLPSSERFEGNAGAAGPFAAVHAILDGDPQFATARKLENHRRERSGFTPSPNPGEPSSVDGIPGNYPDTAIVKTAGQGEFDSIHIAPKMEIRGGKLDGVRVAMAPICAHDCLHTHWRWSYNFGYAAHTRGWDATASYRKSGAPLVPQNQEVRVTPIGTSGFEYAATCRGPLPAREWQAMFAHGSGYSVATMTDTLANWGLAKGIGMIGWPRLYLFLRYTPTRLHPPSPAVLLEAEAFTVSGRPDLTQLVLLKDQLDQLSLRDFSERIEFSANDLAAMRAL